MKVTLGLEWDQVQNNGFNLISTTLIPLAIEFAYLLIRIIIDNI